MGTEQRFLVVKNNENKEIKYFEYNKINGYSVMPKSNVKFEDAINVKKMILINPSLIQKMIDKKIKKKLEYLINLLAVVCENDAESDGLYLALDEAERLRMETINKYKHYMEQEKFEMFQKKIDILEDELKLRIKCINKEETYEKQEGKGK